MVGDLTMHGGRPLHYMFTPPYRVEQKIEHGKDQAIKA